MIAALALFAFAGAPAHALSVKDFGATGDGKTNDASAFQAAIDEAASKQTVVEVPAGRYYIGSNLVLNKKVEIKGQGHEQSVITGRGGKARLFVEASGTRFADLGFEDMTAPIALVSRSGYTLKDVSVVRCRFEDIYTLEQAHQGVIGLSTSNKGQRQHRIDDLVVQDSIFRNIESAAINVRGNISRCRIINNQFLDIVNSSKDEGLSGWQLGGYAIRLGESSDDANMEEEFADQGRHLIEGNVIRNLRKTTVKGNLKAMLLYGNFIQVRNNLFEDLDGGPSGDDVNAMYFRGAYNEISGNVIRNVRGSDDDGAVSFKGGLDLGNQGSVVFHNYIENVDGMSAIEASSSDIEVYENEVVNSTRGFYQRHGTNAIVRDNIFRNADTQLRTEAGEVAIHGNWYIDSVIWLSTHRGESVNRDGVYIYDNLFQRVKADASQMIRFSNNPEENFVSIRNNRFEYTNSGKDGAVVDFSSNGSLDEVEIIDNHVEYKGSASFSYDTGSAKKTISGNTSSSKGSFSDTSESNEQAPGIPPSIPTTPDTLERPDDFRLSAAAANPSMELSWTGLEGHLYQIQFSNDLKTWNNHGDPIAGNGNEIRVENLPASNDKSAFYRLMITGQP